MAGSSSQVSTSTGLGAGADEAPLEVDALRERLAGLTLRDEHRLRRRLDRVRRGHAGPELDALLAEIAKGEATIERRRAAVPAISYPPELPVSARRDDLLDAIARQPGRRSSPARPARARRPSCRRSASSSAAACAARSPTRSRAGSPRARSPSASPRSSASPLGEAVGYAVRFSERRSDDTLVRLMTDGLLLAEIQRDRLLRRYDTIIVDEAHERSLNIDFLLGYLQRLLPQRPDLKLIITSATIDPERFAEHFGDAPGRRGLRPHVPGRDPLPAARRADPRRGRGRPTTATRSTRSATPSTSSLREGPGDVLVFLSGEREIRDTAEALTRPAGHDIEILPLYARLSTAEQQRVFKPHDRAARRAGDERRRDLADRAGHPLRRRPRHRAHQPLQLAAEGPAAADRADLPGLRRPAQGPLRPHSPTASASACTREEDFDERGRAYTDPEILRTNLAAVILQMARSGLGEIEDFPFLDPPDAPPDPRRHRPAARARRARPGAADPAAPDAARPPARPAAGRPAPRPDGARGRPRSAARTR